MTDETAVASFPAQLRDWAGHRAGGVRRLFDDESGRPSGIVFQTNLLHRLEEWAKAFARGLPGTPRIILLVGGPGNGKTEAIESTIGWLDVATGSNSRLTAELGRSFAPASGLVPRLVRVDLDQISGSSGLGLLSIVQDATVVTGFGAPAAQALVEELAEARSSGHAYLCCVNRGVLDDALIDTLDAGSDESRRLLESVTRAVSLFPSAPSCWPLDGFPEIGVWPMDAETLLASPDAGGAPPAVDLLTTALDERRWAPTGTCAAGSWCPFCNSREHLSRTREQDALVTILRWYEVASGKRWSFRDLFSLASYLLSGHHTASRGPMVAPCAWAGSLVEADALAKRGAKPTKESSGALFQLVAAQYQHALFHLWDRESGPSLLRDIKELGLDDDNTAMGLHWFLMSRRRQYLPATIASSLDGLAGALDPALSNPDATVQATQRTAFPFRDLDVRFSRSIGEGLDFVRKLQVLPRAEVELLDRLARLDDALSATTMRRKRPAAASRVQRIARDFACRTVRRTLGARTAAVLDAEFLGQFQSVCEDEGGDELYDVAREVERLLNTDQDFEISLTTTFGQPLPPATRRATLVVPARSVKPLDSHIVGRPRNPIAFLTVGGGASIQPIALTYDLFKAIKELQRGMSPASLPRTVLALLDTTRARLAGPIVRDREVLDRARIVVGSGGVVIEERRQGFAARRERVGR